MLFLSIRMQRKSFSFFKYICIFQEMHTTWFLAAARDWLPTARSDSTCRFWKSENPWYKSWQTRSYNNKTSHSLMIRLLLLHYRLPLAGIDIRTYHTFYWMSSDFIPISWDRAIISILEKTCAFPLRSNISLFLWLRVIFLLVVILRLYQRSWLST